MKNKRKYLFLPFFMIVFSLYPFGGAVATAGAQTGEEPSAYLEAAAGEPPVSDSGVAAGENPDTYLEAATGEKPGADSETATGEEPGADSVTDTGGEPGADSETGTGEEAGTDSETGTGEEAATDPETATEEEAFLPEADTNEETSTEPAAVVGLDREPMEEPDSVSSGTALMEWLKSHRNTGGSVRLTDNVVLDGSYSYCPDRAGLPSVFVDTDQYTITIAGKVEFLSDERLIFTGQAQGRGMFCVAPGGQLSLQGVILKSGDCALWQEEGAGLIVDNCPVSGRIHYADTPFVLYQQAASVIVNRGQSAEDVLPTEIPCTVNRHGRVEYREPVAVAWELEGTQRQQEERIRFRVQGSFLGAAFGEPPSCTVVYNDYPLTFTEVQAYRSGNLYVFRGSYTKPEAYLPIVIISEYSFDGRAWTVYGENRVSDTEEGFFIGLTPTQWDTAVYPYLYIRLQWNNDGARHFSNVLRYAADDLEHGEDQGGTRGGGTTIVKPSDDTQDSPGHSSTGNGTASESGEASASEPGSVASPGEVTTPESESPVQSEEAAKPEPESPVQSGEAAKLEPGSAASPGEATKPESESPVQSGEATKPKPESPSKSGEKANPEASVPAKEAPVKPGEAKAPAIGTAVKTGEQEQVEPRKAQRDNIAIAAGFAAASAAAGAAGFCAHAGIFRKMLRQVKRTFLR